MNFAGYLARNHGKVLYIAKEEKLDATLQKKLSDMKAQHPNLFVSDDMINDHLFTAGIPDPELMIRTSGEQRISNFLLWQLAYTEFYFTEKFWPDFDREELYQSILTYQARERRFGKTTEQIKQEE